MAAGLQLVTVARHAMGTRFEIALHGENPVSLRAAAEEALSEVERLEAQLSLHRPSSEIARVNARAAHEPVRVSTPVFRLLQHAARLTAETGGVFDITVGPLMRCWGFVGGTGRLPEPAELAEARGRVGMHLVELDAAHFTVRFARPGVMLDLGAIGKGYAIGIAADVLREAGVTRALVHGGTSSACAIGSPPDSDAWNIAIAAAPGRDASASLRPGELAADAKADPFLAVVPLRDAALSVSAVWGKSFQSEGKRFGHVLDPRSGKPVDNAVLAGVVVADATEADAFSTALLTLGAEGLEAIRGLRPGTGAMVAAERNGALQVTRAGIFVES